MAGVPGGKLMASAMKAAGDRLMPPGLESVGGSAMSLTGDEGAIIVFDRGKEEEGLEEEDEVIDIDFTSAAENLKGRWLVVAFLYCNHCVNPKYLFQEMSLAWGLQKPAMVRDIDRNKYLIEFDSVQTFEFVTMGGPWRYKGDELLIQPYDGLTPASEVTFDFVPLWVRLFDLPEAMMTKVYARSLGGKLGEVIAFGGAIRNFLRVRVKFPLKKPLRTNFMIRIEGRISTIPIKY